MNEGPVNQGAMIETTDYLEAAGVFRGWKNLFFMVIVVCLLLVQAAFWLVDLQVIPTSPSGSASAAAAPADANAVPRAATGAAADTSHPSGGIADAPRLPTALLKKIDTGHLERTIELVNGILVVAVVLYVLAMFFNLLVSLVGRLGGIRHISRAFFLSVIVLVLVVPWQTLIGSYVPGVVYTLSELRHWMAVRNNESLVNTIVFYLRFSGYWFFFLLLLLVCQMRSARWTKSVLRRLEII